MWINFGGTFTFRLIILRNFFIFLFHCPFARQTFTCPTFSNRNSQYDRTWAIKFWISPFDIFWFCLPKYPILKIEICQKVFCRRKVGARVNWNSRLGDRTSFMFATKIHKHVEIITKLALFEVSHSPTLAHRKSTKIRGWWREKMNGRRGDESSEVHRKNQKIRVLQGEQ